MLNFILAIESSCDETSVSILKNNVVLSNVVSSQLFHKEYGGIVPELASRAHVKIIDRIVSEAFLKAEIDKAKIQLAAATQGPGLIGSLLVGFNYAKAFAISSGIPFIGINHIESHMYSCYIGKENIDFPFISLVVSGGHTILFLVEDYSKYKIIGQTHDDAAGEAFDKGAKMLGLEYPGGPLIDSLAKQGNENFHDFPVSKIKDNPYDFSFSGVKTSLLYFLKKNYGAEKTNMPLNDICASYQRAITRNLVENTFKAAKDFGIKNIAVSGGVSANSKLRETFILKGDKDFNINFPDPKYSTDNGAMIGYTAYLKTKNLKEFSFSQNLSARAFARFDFEKSA